MILKQYGLVYVGTPYTKYPRGLEWAFIDAAIVTARLMQMGVKAYSPIAHTHPLAIYGEIDPRSHDIWLPFDETIMARSDAMAVVKMPGWQESKGIQHEIEYFTCAGKPIHYLCPVTLSTEQR